VARILVADDNSNIQKMVGLALKDQGIDVVAVGNGEAAVRKISDIKPDLVLADVFMPVRNGYEVCQYVKQDPTLAHIPVILLVGAFDPLDEQEAQRVGADGVLKKPFVPPDPLISMVKSALARAGVSYSNASTANDKSVQPEGLKTSDLAPAPKAPELPTLARVPAVLEAPKEFEPVLEDASFVEDVMTKPAPLRIEAGSQTLAFGSMLETSASPEEEAAFLPPANSELAGRDWGTAKAKDEEEDGETEAAPKHSWRRDGAGEEEPVAVQGATGATRDWRETAFEETASRKHDYEGWQPTKEKTGFAETEDSPATIATETRPPAIPVSEPMAPAASFTGDAWAAAIAAGAEEKTPIGEDVKAAGGEIQPVAPAPAAISAEADRKNSADSWFSTPRSPWDAVAHKANHLASTWDTAVAPQNGTGVAVAAPPVPESAPAATEPVHKEALAAERVEETSAVASSSAVIESTEDTVTLPAAAFEAIRQEVTHYSGEPVVGPPVGLGVEAAKDGAANSEAHDDLVARVLAKMSPEMLQAVTREILKPVVEAMVKEELSKKQ
jgi:CheY-like chemotaxis protein